MDRDPWLGGALAALMLSTAVSVLLQRSALFDDEARGHSGVLLGWCEALIYLAAFGGHGTVAAAWLAFKVAVKWKSWEVWAKSGDSESVKKDYVAQKVRAFVLCTAAQLVCGFAGSGVAFAFGAQALTRG